MSLLSGACWYGVNKEDKALETPFHSLFPPFISPGLVLVHACLEPNFSLFPMPIVFCRPISMIVSQRLFVFSLGTEK